jgi:hypothetical protein
LRDLFYAAFWNAGLYVPRRGLLNRFALRRPFMRLVTQKPQHQKEVTCCTGNWREDAEQSKLIASMRDFREMVKAMQDEALR